MDLVNDLLLWAHFIALAMGGAASFGMPVVGSKMPTATADTRPVLFSIVKGISTISRAAMVILIVSGLLLVWLKWGFDLSGPGIWFWIKMLLVVALLGGVIYSGLLMKRAMGGDKAAAALQPKLGAGMTLLLLGVVLSAVSAFH